jgi:hypothetical protein
MSGRRAALPLALLAFLLAPPVASAAPEWTAPVNFPLPAGSRIGEEPNPEVQIAYQSGGIANEAFLQVESASPPQTTLHVGTMAPGGSYSDQFTLASAEGAIPVSAQIAVAPDGAAVLAWAELTGSNLETAPYRYRAAYRPAGSATWEAPFTIAVDGERQTGFAAYLTPAIAADGTAAVGVQHIASGVKGAGQSERLYRLDVAVRAPGGAWTTQRISPVDESAEGLALGFDAGGDLTAAYTQRFSEGGTSSPEDDRYTLIVRRRPVGSGVWGPEENITGSEIQWTADAQRLAVDEAGDAVLAYQYVRSSPQSLDAWAVTRQGPNGSWTTPTQIVSGGAGSAPETAGVAPDGMAYVLYSYQGNSSGEDCEGVVRAQTGSGFTAKRCVSPTNEDTFSGSLAFLGADAYFAWRSNPPGESTSTTIQGARWSGAAALPDVARNLDQAGLLYGTPTLVDDQQGSVAAFYTQGRQLRAAAYDGGPPILLGAGVPTTAAAGQPVSFSASFVDLWSGLGGGQPTWSFGDGSATASGANVSHTFAAPGTYTITLSAADALGNATSSTYTIMVRALPGIPPAPGPIDTRAPTVTLSPPACPRRLSKTACKRRRASRSAWQTLKGTVTDPAPSSGIASVQVAIYRMQGRRIFALSKGRFRKASKARARSTFTAARVRGGGWSLTLPKLTAGTYTILVRASDRAGHVSATVSRTIKLS